MENIFDQQITENFIFKIDQLLPSTQPLWGKMSVSQMLAHCNVTYEQTFENHHPKAKGLKKWMLKLFVKPMVVNDKPYKKNSPTAGEFKIVDEREFDKEKNRLKEYLRKTLELGGDHFDGKESPSFGPLTKREWNNLFYKHLDHHLKQFGV